MSIAHSARSTAGARFPKVGRSCHNGEVEPAVFLTPKDLIKMESQAKPPETRAHEKTAPSSKHEEMAFHPSPDSAMGVEIELQILDRDSGDLSPGAVRILKACEQDKVEGATAELMQSMIEVKTGICKTVDEARDQLFARIRRVRNIASSLGFELSLG